MNPLRSHCLNHGALGYLEVAVDHTHATAASFANVTALIEHQFNYSNRSSLKDRSISTQSKFPLF